MGGRGVIVTASTLQSDEGDKEIEALVSRLVSFKFADKDLGKDTCEVSLKNSDMALLDDPVFAKGQKWLISWGYVDSLAYPRRMVVQKVTGSNPVVVKMQDESVLMDKKPRHRSWHDKTDSEVALIVAEENGYKGILLDLESTKARRANIVQACSDARFLQQLASRNGFVWYCDTAGLHFHPRRTGIDPHYYYVYKNDPTLGEVLEQPVFEGSPATDVAKIRVVARDPLTKKEVSAVIGVATGTELMQDHPSIGEVEELGDPDDPIGARQMRISRSAEINLGYATQDEVNAEATRAYSQTAAGRYKMTATVKGNPLVGAKQLHHWTMPSQTYTGLYYCRECVHTIEPGKYTMSLAYIKDALGKLYTEKTHPVVRPKNESKPELDANGLPKNTEGLHKVPTVGTFENGSWIPKYYYADEKGTQVGDSAPMGMDEYNALPASEKQRLSNAGAAAELPGE